MNLVAGCDCKLLPRSGRSRKLMVYGIIGLTSAWNVFSISLYVQVLTLKV